MAQHLKIKTEDDNYVHVGYVDSYTLCGLTTIADRQMSIGDSIITSKNVNCPDCIDIIVFCKAIKNNKYEKI